MKATDPSSLLGYLPAIFSEEPFLGGFLAAFEKVLLGRDDSVPLPSAPEGREYGMALGEKGLEEVIASVAKLFDPLQAPRDFLPWLASWTAMSLRADLDETGQRALLAQMIPLYRRRGTRNNLQQLLTIFLLGKPEGLPVSVLEAAGEFQIGVSSTVGVDTWVGEAPPHFFHVKVSVRPAPKEVIDRQREILSALIELEKPAHTYCDEPELIYPSIRIAFCSTVGVDTLLGAAVET